MEVLTQGCLEVEPLNDPSDLSPTRVLVVKSSFKVNFLQEPFKWEK